MIYKVKAFENRFKPASPGLVFSRAVTRRIYFDYSCRYDLKTEDQLDINKLFGIGYLPHHHHESARFGWRWNTETEEMEILAYVYNRGRRITQLICSVQLGAFYDYTIYVENNMYVFVVKNSVGRTYSKTITVDKHLIIVGYKLGAYFGGNLPAPKEMIIKTKKIK